MPDPFLDLRLSTVPIAPRATFAATLRRRLEAALDPSEPPDPSEPDEGATMPTTTDAATTDELRVPDRLHAVTAYLSVDDARAAITFYEDVLGAISVSDPIVMPDGRIGHAELSIGGTVLFLADEFPEVGAPSPASLGGCSAGFVVYVTDVEAAVARAVAAGATQLDEIAERYGSRSAWITDPFGHRWNICTALEEERT
jgi:uncharacterized glyoxalase superfamily protein PhnB